MKKLLFLFTFIGCQIIQAQVTANEPSPLTTCDTDNNGFAFFNLTMADAEIIGSQTEVQVTYHETFTDATDGLFPINPPHAYPNLTPYEQVIFARVENLNNGDFATTEVTLLVLQLPNTTAPEPIVLIDSDGDGIEIFDLTIREEAIADPSENFVFYYYETLEDAEFNLNPIANPTAYQNVSTPTQTLYISITDMNSGCFSIESLLIVVDTLPNVPDEIEEDYVVFDEDGDGFAFFNLTLMIPQIIGDQTGLEVTFYETEADAENKTNAIETPEAYENITNPQTIYARTETIYGSFALTTFTIFADENLNTPSFDGELIRFYPNPALDIIHIDVAGLNNAFTIEISNLNGQRIFSKTYANEVSETTTLSVSHLKSGIYFIKVTSGNQQAVKKLIKK